MKTQAETDFNNPKERFGWAFRGIKYGDHVMAIADPIVEQWSEHLSACGFIHVSQLEGLVDSIPFKQQIHYQPPVEGQDSAMNLAGQWQSVDKPLQESRVDIASMFTAPERELLIQQWREDGHID